MLQLDPLTIKDIYDKFKDGDVKGATNDVASFSERYPDDSDLQEVKGLLEEGKVDEARERLDHMRNTRSEGHNAPTSLQFEDRRLSHGKSTEGRQ